MYKVLSRKIVFLSLALTLIAVRAVAEPHVSDDGEEHGYHKNVVGVFTGITHAGRRRNGFALGFEYERRFSERFGLGIVAEHTFGDADVWIAAIPFALHTGHWKLYAAPGVEDGHHGTKELLRLGAEYAFELAEGWEIAPQVNVDLVDNEEVWVFGVVFAKVF